MGERKVMRDMLKIIKERRSIREYKEENLTKSDIDKLINAIRWAPSWTNSQCWEIIIIDNKNIREKLQNTISGKVNPAKKSIVESAILFAFCAKKKLSGYYKNEIATKFGDWFMYDLGIATQNLCLMAESMGLGSVIVGLFNHDSAKQILKLPSNYEMVTMVPVGYPINKKAPTRRKDIADFVYTNSFGDLYDV